METPSPIETPRNPSRHVILAIAIVVLAIIAAAIWNRPEAAIPTKSAEPSPEQTASKVEIAQEIGIGPGSPGASLGVEGFEDRVRAERFVNESQGKKPGDAAYETMVSGVVRKPETSNVYYFATASAGLAEKGRFVGIYRYDSQTASWHRLYKTYLSSGENTTDILRAAGLVDEKTLVLARDTFDRKPDVCESLWLVGDLVTLNLEKPLDGLKPYALPDDQRAWEGQNVASCKADRQ